MKMIFKSKFYMNSKEHLTFVLVIHGWITNHHKIECLQITAIVYLAFVASIFTGICVTDSPLLHMASAWLGTTESLLRWFRHVAGAGYWLGVQPYITDDWSFSFFPCGPLCKLLGFPNSMVIGSNENPENKIKKKNHFLWFSIGSNRVSLSLTSRFKWREHRSLPW